MNNINNNVLNILKNIPNELRSAAHFVGFQIDLDPSTGKLKKIPIDPKTGKAAKINDRSTWATLEQNIQFLNSGKCQAIGFALTFEHPLAVIDIDNCFDAKTGNWSEFARKAFTLGGMAETSISGTGAHIFFWINDKTKYLNKTNKWSNNNSDTCEFYYQDRFIILGGCNWPEGSNLHIYNEEELLRFIPDRESQNDNTQAKWQDKPLIPFAGSDDDGELVEQALKSRGGPGKLFGTSPQLKDLINANSDELGKYFPSSDDRDFDYSSADLSLATNLAYWTGCNPVRIERIMSQSQLCQRDKWKNRPDYRRRTIEKAIATIMGKYSASNDPENYAEILSLDEMLEYLVLVSHGSQIIDRRNKTIRSVEEATNYYKGSLTEIETDSFDQKTGAPKKKRVSTLTYCWLPSDQRLTVDDVIWDPTLGEFCTKTSKDTNGNTAYNLWSGFNILPAPENWSELLQVFLEHIRYLAPLENERNRFLQWLAHILQHPEVLPHTCYLLIAITQGIGRGTLINILEKVLEGYVATNVDSNIILGKSFNQNLSQKLLATVDEIREGGNDKYSRQQNLKSVLVEENRLINPKFGKQRTEKNRCRWIFCSNHLDAIPFDNSDRRVVVIENPTIPRDPDYYKNLNELSNNPDFIASIQKYLIELDISSFNPGERAPMNAAKMKALESMKSSAEKAAHEFKLNFKGDVSTVSFLREFIGDDNIGPKAMGYIIKSAGMKTGKRIIIHNKPETLLIVNSPLSPNEYQPVSNSILADKAVTNNSNFNNSL